MPHKDVLVLAAERLPKSEVKVVQDVVNTGGGRPMLEKEVRLALARNRLTNSICDQCMVKGPSVKLELCGKCYSTWYCSASCRDKAKPKHDLWCAKMDAPPDQGPLRTVFLKLK